MTAPQATTPPTTTPTVQASRQQRLVILLKSKTVWGSLFAAGTWLAQQPHIGPMEIIQAAGMFVAAAGVRDAITQHGVSQQ